jgi:hypothetical protein
MQTAKAASTVARIAERIIALWHSKVFTFWSDHLEKRLINESIESKVLMRLCCNGVVLLRLTRRGRAGRPKNSAKKSKVPAPVNRFAQSRRNCRGDAGSPSVRPTQSLLFSSCVAFGGKADMVRSGAVTLKISPRTCEGGLRFAEQTNFATPRARSCREFLARAVPTTAHPQTARFNPRACARSNCVPCDYLSVGNARRGA